MKCVVRNLFVACFFAFARCDYWNDRAALIELDESSIIGSNIKLSDKETAANDILMDYKFQELDAGFYNITNNYAAQHFFEAKKGIEKSKVFEILKLLPKGASLHSHDLALASSEILYNLTYTYSDHLYECIVDRRLRLKFFANETDNICQWNLLADVRRGKPLFDKFLRSQITLFNKDPRNTYKDIDCVWRAFQEIFATVADFISFKPVFQRYFYLALKELYEDNVMYLEFRGLLPKVYDLNGKVYSPSEVIELYIETVNLFRKDFPNFDGVRFIYAPLRSVNNVTAEEYVKITRELLEKYPEFIAGFDLVGQEDIGQPLTSFVNELQELASNNVKFFFHAGESNWNGFPTDFNLIDAVLLNTTRIGHGYAAIKHPEILKIIKERNIALEISPISNQVLKLVDDPRNHPANYLIAQGYPVVICCDDPSFWGAKALSYDWYVAFMAMSSRKADLKLLKQLALNSLEFSAMPELEKQVAMSRWQERWNYFIENLVLQHPINKYICDLV